MAYKDLTPETVIEYIKKETQIFKPQSQLQVYEIGEGDEDGDGYCNHVYRVWDENGHSVVVKHAKPYLKVFGEAAKLTASRNQMEAESIILRSAITPEYLPQMYHVDADNNLFIYEDCSRLKIMRFELIKGKSFPKFPEQMGEFLAKSNFYTSEIYLDQIAHKALEVKFMNPEMRVIMESILFLKDPFVEANLPPIPDPDPKHVEMSELFWDKREVRIELLKLRDLFMRKSESLVHGDLHTSNIMIDQDEMKIIDMEYPFMGVASSDTGYLAGNLIYQYIAWYYHEEGTSESRKAYREEMLSYLRDMLETYLRVYKECWEQDAKPIYREYTEYRDQLLRDYLKEVCGFTGCQIASRISTYVGLPDYDVLTASGRDSARRLSLLLADALIMKREEIESVADFINLIETITKRYFKVMKMLTANLREK